MGCRNQWLQYVQTAKTALVDILHNEETCRTDRSEEENGGGSYQKGAVSIVVGAFEAGVDTACQLVDMGIDQVILVDSNDITHDRMATDRTVSSDPSVSLAPISVQRLKRARATGRLLLLSNRMCIATRKIATSDGNHSLYSADFVSADTDTSRCSNDLPFSLNASAPIILCTGFDPSQADAIKHLLEWNPVTGGPVVSQDCDESAKTPGLFVCGPMLRHSIAAQKDTIQVRERTENWNVPCTLNNLHSAPNNISTTSDCSEERMEMHDIIFCFIYKFRTRFALVAGEILSRLICDDHFVEQDKKKSFMDRLGHERLEKVERMLILYKERGMLLKNLHCAMLECGGSGKEECFPIC